MSLKVQQTKGQAGQIMISNSWHQRSAPDYVNCPETLLSATYNLATIFYKSAIGVYEFEGKRYSLQPTSNSNIGVIYEQAWEGEDYTPINNSNYALKFLGDGGPMKKSYNYRFRYISLQRLPVGELVVSGSNLFFWQSFLENSRPFPGSTGAIPSVAISVNNTSCALSAPSEVSLKKTNLSLLSLVGDTTGRVNFPLGVTCAASYAPYKILYALEDVNAPGNTTSNLTLNSAVNSASGVSLQVLDGETPVVFGSQTSAATLKGELGPMGVQGGTISKLFGVHYIRTGKMTPGAVNAGVSVTLSYE